jgi:hypothetical protein
MDALSLIIGIGIVCFLLLYFVFNLKEEHFILQLLGIFFFIFLLFLIPKTALDFNDDCALAINQTTRTYIDSANFTDVNTYGTVCDTNTKQTSQIFYNIVIWFAKLFVLYVFGYIIFYTFGWLNGIVTGKRKKE